MLTSGFVNPYIIFFGLTHPDVNRNDIVSLFLVIIILKYIKFSYINLLKSDVPSALNTRLFQQLFSNF